MRENRTYGSEGGSPGNRPSLPLSRPLRVAAAARARSARAAGHAARGRPVSTVTPMAVETPVQGLLIGDN